MHFAFFLLLSLCSLLRRQWADRCAWLSGQHLPEKDSSCCSAPQTLHRFILGSQRAQWTWQDPWCPIPKKPLLHSGPQTLRRRRRRFSLDQLPTVCPFLPPILPSPFLLARTHKTASLQHDIQTPCSGAATAFWCTEKTQNNSDFSLFSASQVPPLWVSRLLHASMWIGDGRRGGTARASGVIRASQPLAWFAV